MDGTKNRKRRGRKHGSQSVFKDRRGCHCVRHLLFSSPAWSRVHTRGKGSADHYSSNRRVRRRWLARLQMEKAS